MLQFDINDSNEYRVRSWEINNQIDNQIIFNILSDVEHTHSIRFAEQKIIWVTNGRKDKTNYLIEITQSLHPENHREYCNDTSFYFGGNKKCLYLFSNLNINTIINERTENDGIKYFEKEDETICPEILFLMVNHDSKITFFNCIFQNTTEKIFKIETFHDAVVEFINCEFIGEFTFKSHHDSIIVRH